MRSAGQQTDFQTEMWDRLETRSFTHLAFRFFTCSRGETEVLIENLNTSLKYEEYHDFTAPEYNSSWGRFQVHKKSFIVRFRLSAWRWRPADMLLLLAVPCRGVTWCTVKRFGTTSCSFGRHLFQTTDIFVCDFAHAYTRTNVYFLLFDSRLKQNPWFLFMSNGIIHSFIHYMNPDQAFNSNVTVVLHWGNKSF